MYDQIVKTLPNKTNRRSICFYLISNCQEGDTGNIDEDLLGPIFFLSKSRPNMESVLYPFLRPYSYIHAWA